MANRIRESAVKNTGASCIVYSIRSVSWHRDVILDILYFEEQTAATLAQERVEGSRLLMNLLSLNFSLQLFLNQFFLVK